MTGPEKTNYHAAPLNPFPGVTVTVWGVRTFKKSLHPLWTSYNLRCVSSPGNGSGIFLVKVPATGLFCQKVLLPLMKWATWKNLCRTQLARTDDIDVEESPFLRSETVLNRMLNLKNKLKRFEQTQFTKFWKREARTVESSQKRVNRLLDPALKYYQLKYTCIHGGQSFWPRSTGIKNTS